MLAMQDLLKNYYGLEPAKTSFWIAMIWIPWQLKILCGIIADSISICGSRKKSWIIVWALVQIVCTTIAAAVRIDNSSIFCMIIFLNQFAQSFMDTVVDSLMVI